MFPLIGPMISAGASLLGGLMNQQNTNATNQQNMVLNYDNAVQQNYEWQTSNAEAMNQQAINNQQQQWTNQFNQQAQDFNEQMAKSGIQWRVADARAAGINPLAALGASLQNAPAVTVSGNAGMPSTPGPSSRSPIPMQAGSPGAGISQAGQDISRAMLSMQSPEEKVAATAKTALDLRGQELDNQIKEATLASSIQKVHQAGNPPGIPEMQTVVRSPDGSLTSGPSRAVEGWSWLNPVAKDQYLFGQEAPQWFGYNVPKAIQEKYGGQYTSAYRSPLTGGFYSAPSFYQAYKYLRDSVPSPW